MEHSHHLHSCEFVSVTKPLTKLRGGFRGNAEALLAYSLDENGLKAYSLRLTVSKKSF